MYDVAIVGCGIVGAATAFTLSRFNLSIIILEKENDVSTGTTKANSGIVHAGYDPEPGTLMARLNVEGNELVRELCTQLDVPFLQCGSLVLALSHQDISLLEKLAERGRANGVPGLVILDRAQLREKEPRITEEAVAALYAPTAGVVSPWELTLALVETAVNNGVVLSLENEVTGIGRMAGGYCLQTEKGPLEARYVVNASGVYADTVHNMIAEPDFRIAPDRGEYYILDKTEGDLVRHVIFQCPDSLGKGTLVAPTAHGNLIVGPNNELPGYPGDTATTAAGLEEVARKAKRLVPSINLRENIRNFAGIRAASDCDDFIIAEAPGAPGFLDLAGIKSPGLTAAPAIARMAAELLGQSGLSMTEKPNFDCTRKRVRFAALPPKEKAALVAKDPAYGHVVCRCETVTEGEVLDALRAPAPPCSLDGVKRRTGAGMGRCQGGFCGPRVMAILAESTGKHLSEIPQEIHGSFQITGETKSRKSFESKQEDGGARHWKMFTN